MRRVVNVGGIKIGGDNPVAVQSMTNTDTRDVDATVSQIERLQQAGCEIVRVAVPDDAAARALPAIKRRIDLPLVADIHFDHHLALASIDAGVDKLRLNPGNITDPERIEKVVRAAKQAGIPIRVGANSGSLAASFLDANGHATADGMVDSALKEIRLLEGLDFTDIVVSLKATDSGSPRRELRGAGRSRQRSGSESSLPRVWAIRCAFPLPAIRWRRCGLPTRSLAPLTSVNAGYPTASARRAAARASTCTR